MIVKCPLYLLSVALSLIVAISTPVKTESKMAVITVETMRQLLTEQTSSLIKEIVAQVEKEVISQLKPHITRLDQMEADHEELKNQIYELKVMLEKSASPEPLQVPNSIVQAPSTPNSYHVAADPPVPNPHHSEGLPQPSSEDTCPLSEILVAKRTLVFYPVTHPVEGATCATSFPSALRLFLKDNLAIPEPTISKMCQPVSYEQEADRMTVVFSAYNDVKTIYRFVRNLPTGVRVSNYIHPCLDRLHKYLQNKAYHLRKLETPHKTVIKYVGKSLGLFAKPPGCNRWNQVPCNSALEVRTSGALSGSKTC